MRTSLQHGTANLPKAEGDSIAQANTTESAIAAGTLLSIVAAIEFVYAQHQRFNKNALACFLTGGDAEHIMAVINIPYHHEPELVLKGLVFAAADS